MLYFTPLHYSSHQLCTLHAPTAAERELWKITEAWKQYYRYAPCDRNKLQVVI